MPPRRRITGVDHVTLFVRDLEIATRFYVGVLGADRVDGVGGAFVTTAISFGARPLIELALGLPGGASLTLTVRPEDLLAARNDLEALGIPCRGPCRDGPPGHASLHLLDPFGNALKLTTMGFAGETEEVALDTKELVWSWSEKVERLSSAPKSVYLHRRRRAPRVSSPRPQ